MDNPNRPKSERDTVKPKGELPAWSDKELEAMATANPVTIADARADAFRSDEKLAALLEAKSE